MFHEYLPVLSLKKNPSAILGTLFVAATFLFYHILTLSPSPTISNDQCDNKAYFVLSEALANIPHVCIFHIHDHIATRVPPEIVRLKNLRILHLHMPRLKQIPEELKAFPYLKELVLGSTQFATQEAEIQKILPHVKIYLDYSHPE